MTAEMHFRASNRPFCNLNRSFYGQLRLYSSDESVFQGKNSGWLAGIQQSSHSCRADAGGNYRFSHSALLLRSTMRKVHLAALTFIRRRTHIL